MAYPLLDIDWTSPLPDERMVYKRKVIEINMSRFGLLGVFALILYIAAFLTELYFLIAIPNLVLILLLPLFINPWDIVLSDKRLILRKRYWFIGRFSTVTSVNLYHVESQRIAPRLKVIPITVGFFIIESFSLVLVEYALTQTAPLPVILEIILLLWRIFNISPSVDENVDALTDLIYQPFLPIALFVGLSSLFIGLALILLGLPYRTTFQLSLSSGHAISINAGVPRELTTLIYSVSRVRRVHPRVHYWKKRLPLLENEKQISTAKVALVSHRTQLLAVLSLYIILISYSHFIDFLAEGRALGFIIFLLYLINALVIVFAFRFAKRYRNIVATNERLIFEDEYTNVSGLWGKRIYQYADLPYQFIQGFKTTNFTAISIYSILSAILILLIGLFLSVQASDSLIFFFTLFLLVLFIIWQYRIHTAYQIISVGGKTVKFAYEIPVIWKYLSYRFKTGKRLYNFLFYNVLSEQEIVSLCNTARNIINPIKPIGAKGRQKLQPELFLDNSEPIITRWDKLAPNPFLRGGVTLGVIVSFVAMVLIFPQLSSTFSILFVLLCSAILIFIWIQTNIFYSRSLLVTKRRIFYLEELQPRKLAILFGKLPEWTISENLKEHIANTKLKLHIPLQHSSKIIRRLLFIIIIILVFLNKEYFYDYIPHLVVDAILVLLGIFAIILLPLLFRDIIYSLPRYSLLIQLRYGNIEIPYITRFKDMNVLMSQ
ncbi:MAG: hypothetical protein ACFFGZ_14935 [Candidatus Thorarchaeota archaeon]